MQPVVVLQDRVARDGPPLQARARRADANQKRFSERHIGERPATAAMAVVAVSLAFAAHYVGTAARTSLLVGTLAYFAIVLLAEVVHLDDWL